MELECEFGEVMNKLLDVAHFIYYKSPNLIKIPEYIAFVEAQSVDRKMSIGMRRYII